MRIAIVEDDEKTCLQLMQAASSWIDSRFLVGTIQAFSSATDFLSVWVPHAFSLVLFDCILSPEEGAPTGMDLARVLRKRGDDTPIVFITHSPDFAVEGYTVHAAGYLLKPVSVSALNEVLDSIALPEALVRIGNTELDIPVKSVVYARANGHYVELHTTQGVRRVRTTFKDIVEALKRHGSFVVTARGYVANLDFVNDMADLDLIMENGGRIPVSRDSANTVRSTWTDYLFSRARWS